MEIDEGYIKFRLRWQKGYLPDNEGLGTLIACRDECFRRGFIGVYPDSGIGFGNISIRHGRSGQFIISGTQTGHLPTTGIEHYARVSRVDFAGNTVECDGPVKASSESMTHAMFYRLDAQINCVIHIHHRALWQRLMYDYPTTDDSVPYGTTEMCEAVKKLYRDSNLPDLRVLVMAGHEEGIVAFGADCRDALGSIGRIHGQP